MIIRTLEQLVESLESDLVWRKRELANLKALLPGRRAHNQLLLRAAICILYAHWEGFVKFAATNYISFIATRGLSYGELSDNFVALGLRSEIRRAAESNRPSIHTDLVRKLLTSSTDRAVMDYERSVNTRQNLNGDALNEILILLGLDDQHYLLKGVLLDQKLLANRNRISHGERTDFEAGDYEELHNEIVELLDRFSTDVQNAAVTGRYRRNVSQ